MRAVWEIWYLCMKCEIAGPHAEGPGNGDYLRELLSNLGPNVKALSNSSNPDIKTIENSTFES
jgi:hypothetical protein